LQKVKQFKEHKLAHLQEIENDSNKLGLELDRWRGMQAQVTPQLGNTVATQDVCDIEVKKLYLPSDFGK